MNISYIIRLAMTTVFAKRLRSVLTVSGIGISIGVIVFMVGLLYGLQEIVSAELTKSQSTRIVNVTSQRAKQLKLTSAYVSKLESISGVESAEKITNMSGKLLYHGSAVTVPIYAVTPGFFEADKIHFVAGGNFEATGKQEDTLIVNDMVLKVFEVGSVGEMLSKELDVDIFLTQEQVPSMEESSKTFTKNGLKLIGIIKEDSGPVAYVPEAFAKALGVEEYSQLKLVARNIGDIAVIREEAEKLGFQTSNVRDTLLQVNRIFKIIKVLLGAFGLVSLVIAILGTLNTVTITLVEQTREIGFLRIVGVKEKDVKNLFISQAMILTIGGALIGLVLGLILIFFVNGIAHIMARGSEIRSVYLCLVPTNIILLLIVFSGFLGWVIGLGPAKRAGKISPLKALRY